MQLFQYDHCPNCVQADMVANYKALFHEKIYLLHGDEDDCYELIQDKNQLNKKTLPIFQSHDGVIITDAIAIAKYFDESGDAKQIIRPKENYQASLDILNAIEFHINCLVFPRNILLGLPEFSSRQSRDEFRVRKEPLINQSFEKALEETHHHKKMVEQALKTLPKFPLPCEHNDTISWDDVMLFPKLRNLTMVLDLAFPDHLRRYIDEVSALTAIHTYYYFEI